MVAESLPAAGAEAEPPEYQRILMFYNPYSRCGRHYEDDVEMLHDQTGLLVDPVKTSPEVDGNVDLLDKYGREGDLNVFRGGDGTVTNMLSAAKIVGSSSPSLLLPRGRVNDLAMQTVSDKTAFRDLNGLIKNDKRRPLFPLEASFEPDGRGYIQHHDVWSTCGIGTSAVASEVYNYSWYRHNWLHLLPLATFAGERVIASGSVMAAKPFEIKAIRSQQLQDAIDDGWDPSPYPVDGPSGSDSPLIERIIANGDRMGKDLRIAANLFDLHGRVVDVRNRRHATQVIPKMMRGEVVGEEFDKIYGLAFTVSTRGNVHVQIGGEAHVFKGGVDVRVNRSLDCVDVLTLLDEPQTP